ncbi:hypothetical protein JTE90_026860 [Oedothorax gibbosus]|uniref:Uncharacterized protein n=1 Tax=Oedothorax gibbosus TaxID=931172 RepID=A0AAV6U0P8_9ARAC|nr:hypothetical protein JTE90_026860 [Oedothorax gibbosus]
MPPRRRDLPGPGYFTCYLPASPVVRSVDQVSVWDHLPRAIEPVSVEDLAKFYPPFSQQFLPPSSFLTL